MLASLLCVSRRAGRLAEEALELSSVHRKQTGWTQAELYFMWSVIGLRVLVPPPTWLNWKPMRASTRAGESGGGGWWREERERQR